MSKPVDVIRVRQIDAHQSGSELAVVLLRVLEVHDIVRRPQHIRQEDAQHARLLRERHEEVMTQALVAQRTLHDLGVARQVVVTTRHDAHDRAIRAAQQCLAISRIGQIHVRGRGRESASRLGDDAVGLVELQHLRAHRALGDDQHGINELRSDVEGERTRAAHRRAVHERIDLRQGHRLPRLERRVHRCRARGLHADDLHLRTVRAQPRRDARDEAAAAHGDQDRSRVRGHLLLELDANRALTGDREGIIVGMNVGAARRARGLLCQRVRAVKRAIHDDLLDPLPTNRGDAAALLAGRVRGQVNRAAHAQVGTRVRQALCVVSCRGTHDPAFALGGGQERHACVGAAHLEGAALLLILTLEQNIHAGLGGQTLGTIQVRANGDPLQGGGCLTDVLRRGHVRTSGHGNSFQYPSSVVVATAPKSHPTV